MTAVNFVEWAWSLRSVKGEAEEHHGGGVHHCCPPHTFAIFGKQHGEVAGEILGKDIFVFQFVCYTGNMHGMLLGKSENFFADTQVVHLFIC